MEAQNICPSTIHSDKNNIKLQLLTAIQRFVGLAMIRRFTYIAFITTSKAG